jgi:hypothetical protein
MLRALITTVGFREMSARYSGQFVVGRDLDVY